MGETTDGGLYEIFQQDYGPVGSPGFEVARENFVISSAGYAVASLLLQPKDRHNGNLLFDKYDLSSMTLWQSNYKLELLMDSNLDWLPPKIIRPYYFGHLRFSVWPTQGSQMQKASLRR